VHRRPDSRDSADHLPDSRDSGDHLPANNISVDRPRGSKASEAHLPDNKDSAARLPDSVLLNLQDRLPDNKASVDLPPEANPALEAHLLGNKASEARLPGSVRRNPDPAWADHLQDNRASVALPPDNRGSVAHLPDNNSSAADLPVQWDSPAWADRPLRSKASARPRPALAPVCLDPGELLCICRLPDADPCPPTAVGWPFG